MSFSAQQFLRQHGAAGIAAYSGVTCGSVTSLYLALRSGVDLAAPVEKCLGADADLVRRLRATLGEGSDSDPPASAASASAAGAGVDGGPGDLGGGGGLRRSPDAPAVNWVREGTYLGAALALDTLFLPLKLVACLPLARRLARLRGARRGPTKTG